jgi:hypothetical protein
MPVDPKLRRGIGLGNIYTDLEVDQLIANAQAGIPVAGFSDLNPLTYQTPATTTVGGERLEEIVPNIVAGLPVMVNGRRYLLALMPAE